MKHAELIESALDAMDNIAEDRQRPVEYAIEQLLCEDREPEDERILVDVIRIEVRKATL